MKNSSKLLALGLVLFLGACSATEGEGEGDLTKTTFLDKVKGKYVYRSAGTTSELGSFSENGKTYTSAIDSKFTYTMVSSVTNISWGAYSYRGTTARFDFKDDGSIIKDENGNKAPVWIDKKR